MHFSALSSALPPLSHIKPATGRAAPNLAVSWQMLAPLEQPFVGVRRNGPGTSGNLGLVPVYLVKSTLYIPDAARCSSK